jgi:hypothetical protein
MLGAALVFATAAAVLNTLIGCYVNTLIAAMYGFALIVVDDAVEHFGR